MKTKKENWLKRIASGFDGRRLAAVAFLLALVVRLAWLLSVSGSGNQAFELPDSYSYLLNGKNLIHGPGLGQFYFEKFYYSHHLTPVYPFISAFLAGGKSLLNLQLFQIALSALIPAILVRWLSEEKFSPQIAFLVTLPVIFDLPSVAYASAVMSETVFSFLLLLSFYLFRRGWRRDHVSWIVFSGILLGFAILTRPIAVYFPPFILLLSTFVYQTKRSFYRLAIWFLPIVLIAGSWGLRNELRLNAFVLSSVGSENLLYFRAAQAKAYGEHMSLEDAQYDLSVKVDSAHEWAEDYDVHLLLVTYRELAWKTLFNNPVGAIKTQFIGMLRLLGSPANGILSIEAQQPLKYKYAWYAFQWFCLAILYLGMLRFLLSAQRRRILLGWFGVAVVVYFLITCGGPEVGDRFRIPIVPFLALTAAVGFTPRSLLDTI